MEYAAAKGSFFFRFFFLLLLFFDPGKLFGLTVTKAASLVSKPVARYHATSRSIPFPRIRTGDQLLCDETN
jgi:hypothetical protein